MLSKFSVKNFKGFKDELVLDLSNNKSYVFNSECIQNNIVSKAIVYGYNGVGKSNLGLAIMDVVLHLTDKNKKIELYENYLNGDNAGDLAEFTYWFKFDKSIVQYDYGKKSPEDIIYEVLSIDDVSIVSYDRRKNQPLEIHLPGTETLNKDLGQIKISVLKYIKSNAVLSKSYESVLFDKLLTFIDSMLLFWQLTSRGYQGYETGTNSMFKEIIENEHFENFKLFIGNAGLESNITYKKEENSKYVVYYQFGNQLIDFWEIASTGATSLVVFYYWLQRIQFEAVPPSFVFIDEFDAFYHQSLSEFIVKELKKCKCQVILTTHNTGIMSNELLRPDCYLLMYKNRIRSLAELTDKELREAHNIEKMYRAGAFDE